MIPPPTQLHKPNELAYEYELALINPFLSFPISNLLLRLIDFSFEKSPRFCLLFPSAALLALVWIMHLPLTRTPVSMLFPRLLSLLRSDHAPQPPCCLEWGQTSLPWPQATVYFFDLSMCPTSQLTLPRLSLPGGMCSLLALHLSWDAGSSSSQQLTVHLRASWVPLAVKYPLDNAADLRDTGSITGLGRSPGGGMAPHSIILAWRIPWTEEPGRLQSMGLQRVRHSGSNLAHTHELSWSQLQPPFLGEVLNSYSLVCSVRCMCVCALCAARLLWKTEISRQEYWSRLPFPPPVDLPHPRTEYVSPALSGGFFTTTEKPLGRYW